jgi:hypothetical protein
MPQLFGFLLAVVGAIIVMRWLSRQQAIISKTINEVAKTRQPPARKIETLEQGEDGVFRPSADEPQDGRDGRS